MHFSDDARSALLEPRWGAGTARFDLHSSSSQVSITAVDMFARFTSLTRLCLLAGWLYSVYVLVVLLTIYVMNQLDRYLLAVVSKPLERDIGFGFVFVHVSFCDHQPQR